MFEFFKVKNMDKKLNIEDILSRYEKDYNLSIDFTNQGYVKAIWVGSLKIEHSTDNQ